MASSGNFATMNPLSPTDNGTVYSNGNLTTSPTSSWSNNTFCRSTMVIPKDKKIYVECRCDVQNGDYIAIGCATTFSIPTSNTVGGDGSVAFNGIRKYVNGSYTNYAITKASVGDIIQIAIDGATNKVWAGLNNTWQSSGDPANGTNEMGTINTSNSLGFDIFIVTQQNSAGTVTMNFGQDSTFGGSETAGGNADENGFGDFKYQPPASFLALCSGNLSVSADIDPAQTDDYPQKQFNAVTYTGNASTNAITGVGFRPDLVICKVTNTSSNAPIVDSSRGANKVLFTTVSNGEVTSADISSFDSDGFTLTGTGSYDANFNGSSNSYVAWCWKAGGGSTSSNSNGSITSSVQSSTAGGFSIITYTGTGSNATIGHGLSAKPDFIMFKRRETIAQNWKCYHSGIGATKVLTLNTTTSAETVSGMFNNTEPTSSVITIGNESNTNTGSTDHIAYCWHSVEGYSKFGTYYGLGGGNSATDNTFVYTGFRPRLIFLKNTGSASSWIVYDTEQKKFNPMTVGTTWNEDGASFDTTNYAIDILSNGWKFRTGNATINSAHTWIYGAWGDVPFKYNNTF